MIVIEFPVLTNTEHMLLQPIPSITYTGDNSILSDAPEGSLMLSVDSSQECEPTDLTPAKRRGTVIDNLDETFDQNSVSRTLCSTQIKKEKTDKSG
ncbi:hypothetical protein F2Q68_00013175 [Brassica cretica]|uniref:Uncharacterized protein n=1 Tax=Brassica cretica TaxID=69181 RepID=A0A8S9HA72_BRACR|nr:hypothetical protein F2Q68_00013175 [Brassica cretica]